MSADRRANAKATGGRPYGSANEVFTEKADTGIGMAENVLARVFESGFTTKSRQNGHGLGLAICKSVLDACSG